MTTRDRDKTPQGSAASHPWLVCVALAATAILTLILGFANLGAPSIWHDEAVHVLVAKHIAEDGVPRLPSGRIHPVAPVYNYILALFIHVFGEGEAAVRAPSVLFGAANVVLTFWVLRPLIGPPAALLAAIGLALSPWSVAWMRQARFYTLQQTLYLLTLGAAWRAMQAGNPAKRRLLTVATAAAFLAGLGTSLHSVLALAPVGAYAVGMAVIERDGRRRHAAVAAAACAVAGFGTLIFYRLFLPQPDADAIFKSGAWFQIQGCGYYLAWLWNNLSAGFFLMAMAGFGLLMLRGGRAGWYAVLAFWVPVLCLSLLLGYRIHRFVFFAFPFYLAGAAWGLVQLFRYVGSWRRSWLRAAVSVLLLIFAARLAVSEYRLIAASIDVARGADTTLATRHPQWRKPCAYVRNHLEPDTAVLATTYMPVRYYVGRVDEWYPNRYLPWEKHESGLEGIADIEELQAFIARHPKGFFLAEWFRFFHSDLTAPDLAWVDTHMTLLREESTGDVRLYRWGR